MTQVKADFFDWFLINKQSL